MTKYRLSTVKSAELSAIHELHVDLVAGGSGYVASRTFEDFESLCRDRALFAVWDGKRPLACCYTLPKGGDTVSEVEFGGLLVHPTLRGKGIGTSMAAFALAAAVVEHDALATGIPIIAHVHGANGAPRGLLKRVGFVWLRGDSYDPSEVPPGLEIDAAGKVPGDTFKHEHIENVAEHLAGLSTKGSLVFAKHPTLTLKELGDALG